MILPILISVSPAPGSYFFWAPRRGRGDGERASRGQAANGQGVQASGQYRHRFLSACYFPQAPLDQVSQAAAALASAGFIPLRETALLTAAVW